MLTFTQLNCYFSTEHRSDLRDPYLVVRRKGGGGGSGSANDTLLLVTPVRKDARHQPQWRDQYALRAVSGNDQFVIECWDYNTGDSPFATTTLSLAKMAANASLPPPTTSTSMPTTSITSATPIGASLNRYGTAQRAHVRGNEEFLDAHAQVTGILIYEALYDKNNSQSDVTEVAPASVQPASASNSARRFTPRKGEVGNAYAGALSYQLGADTSPPSQQQSQPLAQQRSVQRGSLNAPSTQQQQPLSSGGGDLETHRPSPTTRYNTSPTIKARPPVTTSSSSKQLSPPQGAWDDGTAVPNPVDKSLYYTSVPDTGARTSGGGVVGPAAGSEAAHALPGTAPGNSARREPSPHALRMVPPPPVPAVTATSGTTPKNGTRPGLQNVFAQRTPVNAFTHNQQKAGLVFANNSAIYSNKPSSASGGGAGNPTNSASSGGGTTIVYPSKNDSLAHRVDTLPQASATQNSARVKTHTSSSVTNASALVANGVRGGGLPLASNNSDAESGMARFNALILHNQAQASAQNAHSTSFTFAKSLNAPLRNASPNVQVTAARNAAGGASTATGSANVSTTMTTTNATTTTTTTTNVVRQLRSIGQTPTTSLQAGVSSKTSSFVASDSQAPATPQGMPHQQKQQLASSGVPTSATIAVQSVAPGSFVFGSSQGSLASILPANALHAQAQHQAAKTLPLAKHFQAINGVSNVPQAPQSQQHQQHLDVKGTSPLQKILPNSMGNGIVIMRR